MHREPDDLPRFTDTEQPDGIQARFWENSEPAGQGKENRWDQELSKGE